MARSLGGVAFYALAYIYVRAFVPTALTEPLGLFWALIAIPFFVDALRGGSFAHAIIAFGAMAVALMTRMGGMFTIPALMLWMSVEFGETAKEKARVLALSAAVIGGILGLNALLVQAYGAGRTLTGTNFAYTLCGLSIGKDWSACPRQLKDEGGAPPSNEEENVAQLYSLAWKNFRKQPDVFFRRLGSGFYEFIKQLPDALARGYSHLAKPPLSLRILWWGVATIGLLFFVLRRPARREFTFWLLLWTSVLSSAAFVIFDDGRRVLAVSFPLLWLFVARGFGTPERHRAIADRVTKLQVRSAAAAFAAAAMLFLSVPWLAHRLSPVHELRNATAPLSSDERALIGGQRMSGFLVVSDDAVLRNDLPMIHISVFADIVQASGVENYQALLYPRMPMMPFGFVFAPSLDSKTSSDYQYIVPPEVVERRDVKAWRVQIEDRQLAPGPGRYWFSVVRAEPLH